MHTREDRLEVLKNKKVLKNLGTQKIYINEDLTKKEREIQARIRARGRQEKDNGFNTIIAYQKLIIGEEVWKWDHNQNTLVKSNEKRRSPTIKNVQETNLSHTIINFKNNLSEPYSKAP